MSWLTMGPGLFPATTTRRPLLRDRCRRGAGERQVRVDGLGAPSITIAKGERTGRTHGSSAARAVARWCWFAGDATAGSGIAGRSARIERGVRAVERRRGGTRGHVAARGCTRLGRAAIAPVA
jgi:hypothetical protein